MAILSLILVAVALFFLAFTTRRRYGVLGLALCAGTILAASVSQWIAMELDALGVSIASFPNKTLAICIVTILPSLFLLFGGPRYHSARSAMAGSILYASLGLLFLLGPLSSVISQTAEVKPVFDFAARYQSLLVALAVSFAVVDTVMIHGPLSHRSSGKH